MSILKEGNLQFDFSSATSAVLFDQNDSQLENYHDLDQMAKVDFIVEDDEYIYFIEVKDPSDPQAANPGAFFQKIENGKLAHSLFDKYLYTFIFRWSEEQLSKSVRYITLITMESGLLQSLQTQVNQQLTNKLKKKSSRWHRDPLQTCLILNLTTWSSLFPQWEVSRIS